MATYAIGDLQGCYTAFSQLLDQINFDSAQDQLWLVGDLVNRGENSLATLRLIYQLRESSIITLGNHDLHLLAIYYSQAPVKPSDNIEDILKAEDRDILLNWLRQQPLMHYDIDLNYMMAHAGIAPYWTLEQAQTYATEIHYILSSEAFYDFIKNIYGDEVYWQDSLTGYTRYRCIINYFTRMRYCTTQGSLNLQDKGALGTQAQGTYPWFMLENRPCQHIPILFGHWASLGFYQGYNVIGLDSGCVWGKQLTAMRLEDKAIFKVSCG